jgi:hypothetical protein
MWVRAYWPSLCVLVLGILLRFLYLDSDPQYYDWVGYITDEGRWVQHARSLSLQGRLFDQNMDMHFYIAPFYQLANYLMFEFAGVSLRTSRLLSAFCGSAVLILFWQRLHHLVHSQVLFLGVTLLAFQPDLLALSRIGAPEMAAIFMQLLIYFQIVNSHRSAWRISTAGGLMFLALGIKATTVLVLPIYSFVIFFMPRGPNEVPRWRGLIMFWAGLLLPVVLVGVASVIYSPAKSWMLLSSLRDLWNRDLIRFLALSSVYNVANFPFADSTSTFNLWLLGLWLSALGWMAADRKSVDFESYRYLVTAVLWVSLYFVLMLAIAYFPTRYKVHILIPMALCLTFGISLLQRAGIQGVIQTFGKLEGAIGVLWLSFLCFPTAVVLSPLAASVVEYFAVDPERLSSKLVCVALLMAGTTFVAGRYRRNHGAIGFLLVCPLIAGMAWAILSMINGYSFWPSAGSPSHFAAYGLIALVVSGVSIVVEMASRRWEVTRFVTVCALLYLPFSLVGIASAYIEPHYSMRDASRDLGKILSGYSSIATMRAEGLFNENNLRYKSFIKINWPVEKPEILVIAFRDVERMPIVKRNYHLLKSYNIFVSPEYLRSEPSAIPADGVMVAVYQKNGTGRE